MHGWDFQVVVLGQTPSSPFCLSQGGPLMIRDKIWECTLLCSWWESEGFKVCFSWCSFLFLVFYLRGKTCPLRTFCFEGAQCRTEEWGQVRVQGQGMEASSSGVVLSLTLRKKDGRWRVGGSLWDWWGEQLLAFDRSQKVVTKVDHW